MNNTKRKQLLEKIILRLSKKEIIVSIKDIVTEYNKLVS